MYQRSRYKEVTTQELSRLPNQEDLVGMYKYDGGSFFMPISEDGTIRVFSRRPSVKGGFPERTNILPHLVSKKMPEFANQVFNVELIHTGLVKNAPESHSKVSGILVSNPDKSLQSQRTEGPVRAVLHNVIEPSFSTFREKLLHMKKFETAFGNPDVLFVATPHLGFKSIHSLIRQTEANNREGVIVTYLSKNEDENPRLKIKHKIHHNLEVVSIIQELDKLGTPKPSMGALICADATGKIVAQVGTGFSAADRKDAWENQSLWIGRHIQVESMGKAKDKLRSPVYNGESDGALDVV